MTRDRRTATVRVYGPTAEDGDPVYIELTLSGSSQHALKDNNVGRLLPEEILLLRAKLKEHVKEKHPLFNKNGQCGPVALLKCLGLPSVL
jgi:hypothetical protein